MVTFDRNRFFADLPARTHVKLTKDKQAGLEFLLSKFESDAGFTMLRELAYVLATIQWETAGTFLPIKERRYSREKSPVAFDKQNVYWRTGFYGRGYVQLTWERNYAKIGKEFKGRSFAINGATVVVAEDTFLKNPDYVLNQEVSYAVCSNGMRGGWFTGKKLGNYIKDGLPPDYKSARRIINGIDHDTDIAVIAGQYELLLRAAANG